jgi:hypothetical protein
MIFTIEFFRIRKSDNAHALLDRITHMAPDLESAKVKARSLFATLNMPQNPRWFANLESGRTRGVFFGRQKRIISKPASIERSTPFRVSALPPKADIKAEGHYAKQSYLC